MVLSSSDDGCVVLQPIEILHKLLSVISKETGTFYQECVTAWFKCLLLEYKKIEAYSKYISRLLNRLKCY